VFSLRVYLYHGLTLFITALQSSLYLFCFFCAWWPPLCFLVPFIFAPSFIHIHFLAFVIGFLPFSVLVIFSSLSSFTLTSLFIPWSYKVWLLMIINRVSHLFRLAWAAKTLYWSRDFIHCYHYLGSALGFFFRTSLSAFVDGYFSRTYLLCCILSFTPLHFVFSYTIAPIVSSLYRCSRYSSSRNILG